MRTRNIIVYFTAISLLSACSVNKSTVSFEILKPASITYPANVQTIGYLDRSPRTFNSYGNIDTRALNDTHLLILDTMVNNALLSGFMEGKSQSSLYNMEDIVYLQARRYDTLDRNVLLTNEEVDEICAEFDFDALITQDYYAAKFAYHYHTIDYGKVNKVYELHQNVKWTVNVPGQTKPLDTYVFNDTLYFTNQAVWPEKKYLSILEMLIEGFSVVGHSFGIRNVPVWNEVTRIVYTGMNRKLIKAGIYTDKGDWESAMKIWEQNIASENEMLAAKSAHNLAVFYELGDEIDQALTYAKKAEKLWASDQIESYLKELSVRQLNRNALNEQLKAFSQTSQK